MDFSIDLERVKISTNPKILLNFWLKTDNQYFLLYYFLFMRSYMN